MILILVYCLIIQVQAHAQSSNSTLLFGEKEPTYLVVLGTVQDAGSPHAACQKKCCETLFEKPDPERKVVSLGVIDGQFGKKYLFEATPDITSQMKALKNFGTRNSSETPDGIFITHAHIGHYSGLMYLGKEAMNAKKIGVYMMPRMRSFIETNGPWDQLVNNENIELHEIQNNKEVVLTQNLMVKPILVPHRDEYSETVGYLILGVKKKALFIPDIDKWEKWDLNIVEMIKEVDYAFLDATFFDAEEIDNRDISEIPHPFIIESMAKFDSLPAGQRNKIFFIHMNHTNPVLNPESKATRSVLAKGYQIARNNDVFEL